MKASMIIHGGAGSGKYPGGDARFAELRVALEEGLVAMKRGGSLDGVETAVRYMESSGLFNAGKGACLTAEGKVRLDAAVMTGEGRRGCGVALVDCTHHPVTLARWVMERTHHVLVAGDDTRTYAKAAGIKLEKLRPSKITLEKYRRLLKEKGGAANRNRLLWDRIQEGNTVGAVAIDRSGIPAAAVSTGGMWFKLPGRIGDSAVIGAGIHADGDSGAACATGTGEDVIRNALCWNACEYLKGGSALSAARRAVSLMTKRSGEDTAGIITVDLKGRVGFSYNTEAMGRAWNDPVTGRTHVAV